MKEKNGLTKEVDSGQEADMERGNKNRDVMEIPGGALCGDNCLPGCIGTHFASSSMEGTYRAYFVRQKLDMLPVLLLFAFLFDVCVLILYLVKYDESKLTEISIMGIAILTNLILFVLCKFRLVSEWSLANVMPFFIWILLCGQLFAHMGLHYDPLTPSDGAGWVVFFIYASYVMMPLRLLFVLLLSFTATLGHSLMVGILASANTTYIAQQLLANYLLYTCAVLLGCVSYLMMDRKLRRAFQDTRASLEVKVSLEEQKQQQETLLLSVLPKHVAVELQKDVGKIKDGQFNKIYIRRYENVSILFADIVGFTAMSSKMTAQELVKVLNWLFATFDTLADKHNQLRIKILGDCYYCICGVPDYSPEHANETVQMGLDMVVGIAAVRERTKSGVDMRVGIHTGAVLAGVMGLKQWQFDVWSTDVTLANNMEAGGIPGRVHISDTTFESLSSDFGSEPGEGDTRNEYIKSRGIKTYLIKAPVHPIEKGKKSVDSQGVPSETDIDGEKGKQDEVETEKDGMDMAQSAKQRGHDTDVNNVIYEALVEREHNANIAQQTNTILLSFKDPKLEKQFHCEKERQSGFAIGCSLVIIVFAFFTQLTILPRTAASYLTFAVGAILLSILTFFSIGTNYPGRLPKSIVNFASRIETTRWARNLWALLVIAILGAADMIDMFSCDVDSDYPANMTDLYPYDARCYYPQYFNFIAVLVLIGITMLVQITSDIKLLMQIVITAMYCVINIILLPELYDRYDGFVYAGDYGTHLVPTKYEITAALLIISLALLYYNRHMELTTRLLFLWRIEAKNQKDEVYELRMKNEALIMNIMPSHVAKHFLGTKRKDDDLYSHSYDEVGVIFASIPNFADFYTEDAVNNQGVECLRFLNEVISDFDSLLSEPRFKTITKIKTISSTYMAASGMSTDFDTLVSTGTQKRWSHLADLVEFSLAMRDTLEKINQQSFNNFILRVGLNRGPVLAGVIGAGKPHYDIWGDTVNVASRMDGTGKAGHIQVVQATMEILKPFGYKFEERGLVKVKGKGELLTYYLIGKEDSGVNLPGVIS